MTAVAELVASARAYYAAERVEVNASFDALDVELLNVAAHTAAGDVHSSHEAMLAVLDRAYELTGSCDELDALAEAIGFEEDAP